MYKLLGFRILIAPVDDSDLPDLSQESRLAKMEEALSSMRKELELFLLNGHQIIGFGKLPDIDQEDKELS